MNHSSHTSPRSNRRRWLFRSAAVLIGLAPLFVIELVLAGLGWGHVDQHADPFIGFDGRRPLFVLNQDADRYEIAPGRYLCFRPDGFSAEKADNEFRIFCLGGSTVQGRPYSIETSFTTWLELSLQAADPLRVFDVVNCGGISYASYRLVPILEEVLTYQPDLIILYTGHNEFLEDRTYQHIKQRGPATRWALRQATRLRSFNLLWSRWNQWWTDPVKQARPTQLPTEVQARLDYRGGLELYHRDLAWRRGVIEHFDYNLRRMIALCQTARVPIWIVDPVCNLASCPPFKSEHREDLSDAQLARWKQLRQQAEDSYGNNLMSAVRHLEQAWQIDNQHAGLAYDLAKCYESLGRLDEARQAYLNAKELDVCPLRIIEPLREVIGSACRDTQTPRIDVNGLIQQHCRHGIPGGYLLVDHVHPSIKGHQMIAELLVDQWVQQQRISTDESWVARRDRRFAEHTATLDDKYYLEGQRRLDGLRGWAAGRATLERGGPPLEP